ncbi:MAG: A/G-specific adenine glycosylase [Pseudomonadota bacterium]
MNWLPRLLLAWFDEHGRRDLPWQQDRTPYRVWVSEIMLQQTQVATVIGYYERFMKRFPDVRSLAAAAQDDVLAHWTGLGYYARGRNLHKAAQQVVNEHDGRFPHGAAALETLPGIGPSTAGAIAAIAQGERAAILDGNVKRVLARFHAVDGYPGNTMVSKRLWHFARYHTPAQRTADYTQAIMDLGATLCTSRQPRCDHCPLAARCEARALDAVANFPGRKPKRAKPEREAYQWLLINDAGACLLRRRPDRGLWGGLWTPPQSDWPVDQPPPAPEVALADLLRELNLPAAPASALEALPPYRHTFTHFHLRLRPFLVSLGSDANTATVSEGVDWTWQHPGATSDRGLSKPALKMLKALQQPSGRLSFS